MKYNLYLLNFNNYYNRQVRKMSSIQDYIDGGYVINTLQDCNFEFKERNRKCEKCVFFSKKTNYNKCKINGRFISKNNKCNQFIGD